MTECVGTCGVALRGFELDSTVSTLVSRVAQGDGDAFEQLYRLHVGKVYALCLRMVADPTLAEVLTQDAFVRAWQKMGTYRGRGPWGAWLRRLAINVVIENRRAEARQAKWLDPNCDPSSLAQLRRGPKGLGSGHGGAVGGVVAPRETETAIDLERAIAALPPGARLVFVLHDVYGYRHREIGTMTGVAEGTVKAQLHRARKLLRDALSCSRKVREP